MNVLSDPLSDRVVKDVQLPPHRPLQIQELIKSYSKLPDWKLLKSHLADGGIVSRAAALYLITQCKFIFEREKNILEVSDPITIIGDIHGQFYDLLFILEQTQTPLLHKYLFLGDYIDRGRYSIEVILLLFALKINFPYSILMLRGNHESRIMTSQFSFRKEVLNKYSLDIFELLMDTFDALPLACVLNNKYFAVHGGISPSIRDIEDISYIDRFHEPPTEGTVCDLLWADPWGEGKKIKTFEKNSTRGCSFFFNGKAVKEFLSKNNLKTVIRAHEVQMQGYKLHQYSGDTVVITIFSAANYCGSVGNKGAICHMDNSVMNFEAYDCNPQPFDLPYSQDAISWSVQFAIEKILQIFSTLLSHSTEDSTSDFTYSEDTLKQTCHNCFESEPDYTSLAYFLLKPDYSLKAPKKVVRKINSFLSEEDFNRIEKRLDQYLTILLDMPCDRRPFSG